jgi:hypothetical protein
LKRITRVIKNHPTTRVTSPAQRKRLEVQAKRRIDIVSTGRVALSVYTNTRIVLQYKNSPTCAFESR